MCVWKELKNIPHGETCSYSDIARKIGKPTACRTVAQAIGTNHLALIIPCHRVINTNGKYGGYSGGTFRKCWLIDNEKSKRAQH
jgi:AraC family transcriptional regulator of adaptative response/methylated-DNA-[protein]-cysteine methyltransferase